MAAAFLASLLASAAPASAQDAQPSHADQTARETFEQGRAAFAEGRFEDAYGHFELAYELSGRVALQFNLASAAERLRWDEKAVAHYEAFLEGDPDTDRREFIESRLRMLRASVSSTEPPPPTDAASTAAQAAAREEPEEDPVAASLGQDVRAADATAVDESSGVLRQWWFWTAIGVVVVGAAAASIAATRDPGTQRPIPGDVGPGGVVWTLEVAR